MFKMESWAFLADTKEAAINVLLKQQRVYPGTLSSDDYRDILSQIDKTDLSMPPPVDEDKAIADGWRWIIKVSYKHEEWGGEEQRPSHYLHKFGVTKEMLIYGLVRRT